jgi:hypothetical protein
MDAVDGNDELRYSLWATADSGRLYRCTQASTRQEVCQDLLNKLPAFVKHHRIKALQHEAYEAAKSTSTPSCPLVQIDFAENFSCFHQDEIQAAHWNHAQITLFTCCIWTGVKDIQNFVVASDNLEHNKETATAFLLKILEEFQQSSAVAVRYTQQTITYICIYTHIAFSLRSLT